MPNSAVVSDDAGNETIFPAEDCPLGRDISDEQCEFIFADEHKGQYVNAHRSEKIIKGRPYIACTETCSIVF